MFASIRRITTAAVIAIAIMATPMGIAHAQEHTKPSPAIKSHPFTGMVVCFAVSEDGKLETPDPDTELDFSQMACYFISGDYINV